MSEIWKPIKGFNNYDVSNKGRVRSWMNNRGTRLSEPRFLSHNLDKYGYPYVVLYGRDMKHTARIHHLVALAFLGPRLKGHDINHKNGIRHDNRPENLEYTSRAGNLIHARDMLGKVNGTQILTRQCAIEVIALLTGGTLSYREIAAIFGVANNTIAQIWRGVTWADLPRSYPSNIDYRNWRRMQREKGV